MAIVNTALTLKDLPTPPEGKTGWPWTEQTEPLSDKMPNGSGCPCVSIVTPNYNQGNYLEETIRSVLLQGYPNLEYIIIDADSTDNSVEIIKKYEKYLAYWVSESDRGQSHGINKGLQKCTGDYVTWMNSSDCYMEGALISLFGNHCLKKTEFIFSNSVLMGETIKISKIHQSLIENIKNIKYLLQFFYNSRYIIPSQAIFLSKSLLIHVGFLDEDLHYCMDLDWLVRIALVNPSSQRVETPFSFYRQHEDSKTATKNKSMKEEAKLISQRYMIYLKEGEKKKLYLLIEYSDELDNYYLCNKDKTFGNFIKTIGKFPQKSLSLTDRRFLGMIKQALFL
ncbi:glycosyltransferase family 2 protein [Nostoc sp.]|uniref:glycosyltransferase family 2 protein n=1 Tax=Nostoc sp. TaxID=1180 RepID=UPI002FF4C7FB